MVNIEKKLRQRWADKFYGSNATKLFKSDKINFSDRQKFTQEVDLNYHPGSLGIPNNNYTKRSKKRIKHQKISKCLQRAKFSGNNKKKIDVEAKKLWRYSNFNKQHKLSDLATQYSLMADIKV